MAFRNSCFQGIKLPKNIYNLLSTHFSSVYRNQLPSHFPNSFYHEDVNYTFATAFIDYDEIFSAIYKSKIRGSLGPHILPSVFIKNCAFSLLHPLFLLFNQSINSGIFPSLWKTSYITSTFKSGDQKDVSNYGEV